MSPLRGLSVLAICMAGCPTTMDSTVNTRLIKACGQGDAGKVSRLIDMGADPNAFNGDPEFKFSALMVAVEHPSVVAVLLKRGANPQLTGMNGLTSASFAAAMNAKSLQLLLDAGASPNAIAKESAPLSAAASSGRFDCVKLLLDRGADVRYRSADGICAFDGVLLRMFVKPPERLKMLQLLLDHGADINDRNPETGGTPLHYAITLIGTHPKDRAALVQFLLDHGADPKVKDKKGQTPLDLARSDKMKTLGIATALEEMLNKKLKISEVRN